MKRALFFFAVPALLVATAGCKRHGRHHHPDAAAAAQPPQAVIDEPTATVASTPPVATAVPTAKPAVTSTAPTASAASPAARSAMPFADGQTWNGSYVCVQGPTGVALHISHVAGNNVDAVFDFTVPAAPNGKYKMSGVYEPAPRHLRLNPGDWIARPKGYGPVPVDATVSADAKSYVGVIDASGCSTFAVRR